MGQYYKPIVFNMPISEKSEYTVYNRYVDTEYTMAKLTEHSWFGNYFCDAIGNLIFQNPKAIIWCGDYAEDEELSCIEPMKMKKLGLNDIWGDDIGIAIKRTEFNWTNKYIINLSKGEYIDVNKYSKKSVISIGQNEEGWVINPIPLLCSVGNGRGGGDYNGSFMDYVGTWAGDCIVIEDRNFDVSKYYELDIYFKEACYL